MTTLEARVAALENDILVIVEAIRNVSAGQTLFASMATWQLQQLVDGVNRLRDNLGDGDEWKDFE